MKYLVLAMLFAVIQAPPPVPRKTADDAAASRSSVKSQANTEQGVAMFVLCLIAGMVLSQQPNSSPANQQDAEAADAQQSTSVAGKKQPDTGPDHATTSSDSSPEWYTALERPEWAAVIVAAIGVGIIGWQSWETRKAAKASNESAKALISAERPWLSATVEKPDSMVRYEFSFKNLGRTPALVIGVSTMRLTANDLPGVPDYMPQVANSERFMEESGNLSLLAPGESWRFKTIDFSSHYPGGQFQMHELEDIGKGIRKLFFYGKVRYRDVFKGNEFLPFGQKGYNKYT